LTVLAVEVEDCVAESLGLPFPYPSPLLQATEPRGSHLHRVFCLGKTVVGAGEQGVVCSWRAKAPAQMESAHPPLPIRLPVRRYRGNLAEYLDRLLPDIVRYLEAHAQLPDTCTADRIALLRAIARLYAQVQRHRDRHRVRVVCKLCRHHRYVAARARRGEFAATKISVE